MKTGTRNIIKYVLYKILFPLVYYLGALRNVCSKKVVFVELHGSSLSNGFKLLKESIEQREKFKVEECYIRYQRDSISYYKRCFGLLWKISNAAYIFLNDSSNVLGAFRMRRESKMIQIWHGCGAFKKWGFSVADKGYGQDYNEMKKYPYHRNYSLVPVSAPEVVWAYQEAFQIPEKLIRPIGVSRTDIYYRENFRQQAVEKYYRNVCKGREKRCILYAPTFRGERSCAESPEVLDYSYLKEKLGDSYIIIEKRHPFVQKELEVAENLKDFVQGDCGMTIEELLCVADICVTDYSSIIFEYAIFEKPMIFLAYDLEQYFDKRGFYYDYKEFVPGPIVHNTKELEMAVRRIENNPQESKKAAEMFRQKFMSACDGNATERILQEVLKDE